MPTRDWNAADYDELSAPLEAMGRDVLDRLDLRGDEAVLDAGCGSGRVTAALADRLPDGRVIAVDASPSMVREARRRLGARADVHVADITALDLPEPVDAVLSTATFHWIGDHDRLFARLRSALCPGGALVAQCGGEGNIAATVAAIAQVAPAHPELAGWAGPWHFAGTAETAARLRRASFTDVWTWRTTVRVVPDDVTAYLETVVLGSHLERLPAGDRRDFVAAVAAAMPEPAIDYVRLNILARAAR